MPSWYIYLTFTTCLSLQRLQICENVFFFFSSRRRHTRFKCDWSSDVCSSDLPSAIFLSERRPGAFSFVIPPGTCSLIRAIPAISRKRFAAFHFSPGSNSNLLRARSRLAAHYQHYCDLPVKTPPTCAG